jgi:predicted lysophospholipase L1 biosynthesis ABC-type transport system permease subunit
MLAIMPQKFPPAPGLSMKVFEQARIGPDVHPLDQEVIGDVGRLLWVLMGSIGLLLLIACASVANLMLVRTEARQQELAVRAALGAGWRRLAGELFSESMGLAMAGGVIGSAWHTAR